MPRLVNPDTGTVVQVEGDLAERYRSRGWAELDGQPKEVSASPEKPNSKPIEDAPATRSNTRRKA